MASTPNEPNAWLGCSMMNRAPPSGPSLINVRSGAYSMTAGSWRNMRSAVVWLPIRYSTQCLLSPARFIIGRRSALNAVAS